MSNLHGHNDSLCDRFQDWLVDATAPADVEEGAGTRAQGVAGLGLPGTPPLELSEGGASALEMAELPRSERSSGDFVGPRAAETCDALLGFAPGELREHAERCSDCRDAADDLVTLRKLLRDLEPVPVAGPFFAARVMANIAAQESAERSRLAAVLLAVPRFASRLSWVAAVALVFACGWLYERPATAPAQQTASAYASEHLFDPPTLPPNHDDVLFSLNENEQ